MASGKLVSLDEFDDGRTYAGYGNAYKGYAPELLIEEGSYRAFQPVQPVRITIRDKIEDHLREQPRVSTTYDSGITITLVTCGFFADSAKRSESGDSVH